MHVLILEKDAEFREHLAGRLARLGHEVTSAEDAEEALACCHRSGLAVILVGLRLGGLDERTFLERVAHVCPEARVIGINHPKDVALSIEAMKRGVKDEVHPPVDIEDLDRRIRAAGRGD
ncbi:MAG: response regulator [Desulfovibrionaceae bacterium]